MAGANGAGSALSAEHVKVSVLGGGAWGTALAMHAARKGHDTLLWALEKEVADDINARHENTVFFKVGGVGCAPGVECGAHGVTGGADW